MNEWTALIIGAFLGAGIQTVIQTPFEDFIERRFKQFLRIGIYKNPIKDNFDELLSMTKKAIKNYEFEYARILLDRMEWQLEQKVKKEKELAMEDAAEDFDKDKKFIKRLKGVKEPLHYNEAENKWVKKVKNSK